MNYFVTKHGDILPFHHVLKLSEMNVDNTENFYRVRIYNLSGAMDLVDGDALDFKQKFTNWLMNSNSKSEEILHHVQKIEKCMRKWDNDGLPSTNVDN